MAWKIGLWGRPGSNSAKIASYVGERVGLEVIDFHTLPLTPIPDGLLIISPNHGDAEVPEDLEKFLLARGGEINNWVVLEIGNYGGFDDWSYGARERIALYMKQQGKKDEAFPGAGIDTLPRIDWHNLTRWCDTIVKSGVRNAD